MRFYDEVLKRSTLLQLDRDSLLIEQHVVQLDGLVDDVFEMRGPQFGVGLFDRSPAVVADRSGQIRRAVGHYPFVGKYKPSLLQVNRFLPAVDPDRGRIALGGRAVSEVIMFSADGDSIGFAAMPRHVSTEFFDKAASTTWSFPGVSRAVVEIAATPRYVYILFCGCLAATDPKHRKNTVQVYDWSGRFVSELFLSPFPQSAFAVSPDDRFLYASVVEPEPRMLEWALPSTLPTPANPQAHPR